MNGRENETFETPAELVAISGALDALGERERASAPAGMEARVADRTAGMLEAPAPLVFTRTVRTLAYRVAAVVALCGAAAVVYLGTRPTPLPGGGPEVPNVRLVSTLEDDVDLMLALRGHDPVGERIDVLFSDTAAVQDSLRRIGDELLEGDSL
ncbi:MAG: hypothetical protein WD749_04525 [Phycisphaerales bacterium]